MKSLKNFIVYVLIACMLIWNTFFSYAFAEWESNQEENKCLACNVTPVSMQTLINFEVELLWILQWASWKAPNFWTNKSSWLFAWGVIGLSKAFYNSTKEKIKSDLDSEIKATRAVLITSVLLSVLGAEAKDSMYSIEILRKDESFVRDYKILQELDLSINDLIWDMWVEWIWNDHINPSIRNEIIWLQKKYTQQYWNNNVIFDRFVVSSDARYSNISMFLLRLNSFMKSALMALGESTPVLNTSVSSLENLYSNWSIEIIINKEYIQSIRMDYGCVSLSTCSKTLKQARNDLSNIQYFTESFWKSRDTIKKATKNLIEVLSSQKSSNWAWEWLTKKQKEGDLSWLTDRQIELLYSIYGIDAYNLTTSQIETLKQNFEQIKKETLPVIDGYNDSKIVTKETRNIISTTSKWIYQWGVILFSKLLNLIKNTWIKQEQDYINSLSQAEKDAFLSQIKRQKNIPISDEWKELIEYLQNTVDDILSENWKDKEMILVWVNQDAHYFVEIGWIIHSIVENDIWDKSTDWWLVKILWETCEYQCKNHWGKCYRWILY